MAPKTKKVQLRYIGYMEHYERKAHLQNDGSVDRGPTNAERYAASERIVEDMHVVTKLRPTPIDQPTVIFDYNNDFTAEVLREAAEWLIAHEKGEWEIVGEEVLDEEVIELDSES